MCRNLVQHNIECHPGKGNQGPTLYFVVLLEEEMKVANQRAVMVSLLQTTALSPYYVQYTVHIKRIVSHHSSLAYVDRRLKSMGIRMFT